MKEKRLESSLDSTQISALEGELLEEIITMLMAALNLAGAKDERIEDALDLYYEAIDKSDDDAPYDYKSVVAAILELKKNHKELFK